jgi:hypothetical protein
LFSGDALCQTTQLQFLPLNDAAAHFKMLASTFFQVSQKQTKTPKKLKLQRNLSSKRTTSFFPNRHTHPLALSQMFRQRLNDGLGWEKMSRLNNGLGLDEIEGEGKRQS